jgi:hypothetical protein
MRRRSQRATLAMAALALASGGLAACSLLTGLDADYSSSAHDGAIAPSGEGGGADAPGSDGGGMEASANDGMVTPDGDAAVLSFCETAKGTTDPEDFFCTDFENDSIGTSGPKGWDALTNNLAAGGTIALLADAGIGGSHALDFVSNTTDTALYRQLRIDKKFTYTGAPSSFKSFEVELHFRVLTSAVDYDAFALLVFGGSSPKENGVAGYKAGVDHQISHEGPLNGAVVMVNDGQWHDAKLVLEHADAVTPFVRSLSFNDGGTIIETKTPNHTFDPAVAPVFSIGTFNTAASAGLSHVQFDNVVVRRRRFP